MTHLTLLAVEYDNPLRPAAYCLWLPRIQASNPGLELFYDRRPALAPGDATGDCRTSLPDFALLAAAWLATVPGNATPDFHPDGTIDFHDLAVLAGHWLAPIVLREFRFDASPAWTAQGPWSFGPPQGRGGSGRGHPDPSAGGTGVNVCGVALSGDYAIADGQPKLHLRWGYEILPGARAYSGWNLDDVVLWANP